MRDDVLQLGKELLIVNADCGRAPFGLDADLLQTRGWVLDLVGPLGRRRAEIEGHRLAAERDRQHALARADLFDGLEWNRQLDVAAAELQDVGLEPRFARA